LINIEGFLIPPCNRDTGLPLGGSFSQIEIVIFVAVRIISDNIENYMNLGEISTTNFFGNYFALAVGAAREPPLHLARAAMTGGNTGLSREIRFQKSLGKEGKGRLIISGGGAGT
jgi:hypothetical protein